MANGITPYPRDGQIDQVISERTLSPTQAPGVWYTDRYAPAGFVSEVFDGDARLKHSIDASDCSPCRPGGFNSGFYDTQGRKYDLPGTTRMTIDLYVPSDWATTERRMAGFWGTGFDSVGDVSSFPIIEFTSTTDGSGVPRFRGWSSVLGDWVDMGLPTGFVYDAWYTLEIELVGANWVYTVGDLVLNIPAIDSVEIGNVILQGHNNTAGVTYDIYWDSFTYNETPSATDNCDATPSIVGTRSDNLPLTDPYPAGVTTITWVATDDCGNSDQCEQTVTVAAVNEFIVDVELSPAMDGAVDRCITFELFETGCGASVEVEQVVSFDGAGFADDVTVLVPCGDYECVTARDRLHTLRRTETPVVAGTQYTADFTGDTDSGGDWLVGGNLNDDEFIDILDFGVFSSEFGNDYGTGDTTCATPFPHADISGNGLVTSADFTFISINFLDASELDCCAAAHAPDPSAVGFAPPGPVTEISVAELHRRGLGHLAAGDLNRDGMLDQEDMAAFMMGARPSGPSELDSSR